MKRRFYTFLLLLALLLGGCSAERERSDKPSPDWSRGLRLGRTDLKQPVALQVDAQRHVHMVWCDGGLQYAHLDEQAQVLSNESLNIDTPLPRRPQLLVDGENQVHLAWLSREDGIQRLYHALIQPSSGSTAPLLLSREGEDVSSFHAYLSPAGQVAFVWASERSDGTQGLVHIRLAAPDVVTDLAQPGIDPFVTVDRDGMVHLAWLQEMGTLAYTIYYATLSEDSSDLHLVPASGFKLDDFELSQGAIYYGPLIGLDAAKVYVIWSVHNLGGGLTPTAAFSYYVAFDKGNPTVTRPHTIALPAEARPEYADHSSPFGLTKLALILPVQAAYGSDFVTMPATVPGSMDELPVAFSLMTESAAKSQIRLATAILSGGEQIGYQLSSAATNASLAPSLALDPDTKLHLAWIETAGTREYDVYYASTAPAPRQWLDRTTVKDVAFSAADMLFGALSGIGLLPFAGIWTFPSLIWVVLFFILSGQEELDRTPTRIGFAVAIVIYVGMKVLLLPGLFRGTPFLYAVPQSWAVLIGIVVPLAILLLALGTTYLYARRAQRATIFVGFVVFALTDVVLTLVLYAPGFFGRA